MSAPSPTKLGEDYSVWKEAALVVSLLVNCVNLIGFVSNGWAVPADRDFDPNFEGLGLWKYCSHNLEAHVSCVDTKDANMPSWFKATQAMATIGFTCMIAAFFTIVISECHKALRDSKKAILLFIILAGAASFFTLLGVIIFGSELYKEPLSLPGEPEDMYMKVAWSFVCCAISSIAHCLSTFCGLVEMIYFNTKRKMQKHSALSPRLDQSFSPYTSFPDITDQDLSEMQPSQENGSVGVV